jgi:hypothetical protein
MSKWKRQIAAVGGEKTMFFPVGKRRRMRHLSDFFFSPQ